MPVPVITPRTPGRRVGLAFRIVALSSLIAALGQVTLGGVVRVTESGLGCPDWPLCHGGIIPPFELSTLIEYTHRLSASALGLLVLALAALAWVFYRSSHWVTAPSLLALALVIVAAALGGVTVLTDLEWWGVLLHLGVAQGVVACVAIVVVALWSQSGKPKPADTDRLNRLVFATVLGTFLLILSGSYMVGQGYGSSCGTWPLCRGEVVPNETPYAIHMGHRFVAAAVGVMIAATAASAWLRRAQNPALAWSGVLLGVLFLSQVLVGAATVWSGFPIEMKALHLSLATLVWAALVTLASLVYLPQRLELGRLSIGRRGLSELEGLTP